MNFKRVDRIIPYKDNHAFKQYMLVLHVSFSLIFLSQFNNLQTKISQAETQFRGGIYGV